MQLSEGFAVVSKNEKEGIINSEGKVIVDCIYESVGSPTDGMICVKQDGKWGFTDYYGKLVIPCRYKYSASFENGIAGVETDKECLIISKDTRTLARLADGFMSRLSGSDMFVHYSNSKRGLVNKEGKYLISRIYDDIGIFYGDDLISVKKGEKWGFCSITGSLKIPCQYEDRGYHFEKGIISVKKNGKWGMINTSGGTVVDFKYDEIKQNSSFSRAKLGEKWGAISAAGVEVLTCKYDEVDWINTTYNYFPVTLNGQKGYADFFGNDTF